MAKAKATAEAAAAEHPARPAWMEPDPEREGFWRKKATAGTAGQPPPLPPLLETEPGEGDGDGGGVKGDGDGGDGDGPGETGDAPAA